MLFTNTLSMLLVTFNPPLKTLKTIFMVSSLHLIWILFFLTPMKKLKLKILLSLHPSRNIVSNVISTKILTFLTNDVSSQLTELFNYSFSYCLQFDQEN